MAAIRRRHNRWEARVRIPKDLEAAHGGKTHLYRTIATSDKRTAKAEADGWEAMLRAQWAEHLGHDSPSLAALRQTYERTRREAADGSLQVHSGDADPVLLGIEHELDRLADDVGEGDLSQLQEARLAALQDAASERRGVRPATRPELELTFAELADTFMALWKRQRGLKPTNTEQQKRATFHLFARYWGDRPIRGVGRADASAFYDALRSLDPSWGRTPAAKTMTWKALMDRFGDAPTGPADATMNRHSAALKALWDWAADRDHCEGRNPFTGFHRRLRVGVNVVDYRAWETGELKALFTPPPRRHDLTEIMLVGLFSGMRLDEIASLTWGQICNADGVDYVQVADAKTPAGNRQVPIHTALSWLLRRTRGDADARVWPTFNPEGPGKKAGADAGREFSRFKTARGFADRRKVFHSFRKNVTRQMERAQVPENEWAQVFGHEKGFTYGRYNADGVALAQKAAIIAVIAYPELDLPHPAT